MTRTLRSKKLRAAIYYAQGGKCAICGCDLPDGVARLLVWAQAEAEKVAPIVAERTIL